MYPATFRSGGPISSKPKSRICVHNLSETSRYYGDFRDHEDVGGGREVLKSFGSFHRKRKPKAGVAKKWLVAVEKQLDRAVGYYGKDRELETIRPSDVRQWIDHLRETPNGRGLRCPACGTHCELGVNNA